MAHCRDEGIYDPSLTRGRGAWRHGNDIIFHAGDTLYVNGKPAQFEKYTDTKHWYVASTSTMRPVREAEGDMKKFLDDASGSWWKTAEKIGSF